MAYRLDLSRKENVDTSLSPLEVRVNKEKKKIAIGYHDFGYEGINFEDCSFIDASEYRGKYPAVKIVYPFGDEKAREKDVGKIRALNNLNIQETEDNFEGGIPFLDLVFEKGSLISVANFDVEGFRKR